MKRGKLVWIEDDCTVHDPRHELVEQAYRRIAGVPFVKEDALEHEDHGDCNLWLMPSGYIVLTQYPGGDAIYESP